MSFVCIVIALDKFPKSQSSFNLSLSSEKLIVLKASTPASLQDLGLAESKNISQIEMAISLSHQRARNAGLTVDAEWVLILEEDAIPLVIEETITNFLNNLDLTLGSAKPKAVHFAPEQFGILFGRKSKEYYNNIMLADCAVAYALNKSALARISALSDFTSEVADWPKVLKKIRWYSPKSPFFAHPNLDEEGLSASTSVRTARLLGRNVWHRLFSKKTLKTALFLGLAKFGDSYGIGYVVNERYRSKVVSFYSK